MRIHLPGPHRSHGRAGHGGHAHDDNSFAGAAEHYDRLARRWMRGVYRRIARDVVAALPVEGSVLDIGTGPGHLLVEIGALRPDVHLAGIDPAPDMIEAARRNLAPIRERATAVVGDVVHLPFDDGSFDVVVSSLSLHHWADPTGGGAEVARVRRPGGQVRIYDLRSAPFADLQAAVSGDGRPERLPRFPITPLPFPALRRLVL